MNVSNAIEKVGETPASVAPTDGMKPERIQLQPDVITLTWAVPGDQLGAAQLLGLVQGRAVGPEPAHVNVRQKVQYRLFASVCAFFNRLLGRSVAGEKSTVVEIQVLADPAKAAEAGELIKTLTQLANG